VLGEREPAGAISESVLSDFNGLRRHFRVARPRSRGASAPREPRSGRRFRSHFVLALDETENQVKSTGVISPGETKRFATGSQVLEIIWRAKSVISRDRLFSMA
jgi:hypothetical protein